MLLKIFKSLKIKLWLFCNLIFVMYLLHYTMAINNFILSILINLIVFILPGLGWIWLFGKKIKDISLLIFCIIFLSTIILFLGVISHIFLGIGVSVITQFTFIFITTNIGIIVGNYSLFKWESISKTRSHFLGICIVTLLVYIFIYISAIYIVPPMQDDDLDVQGPAYSLLNYLKPIMLTDRATTLVFDHPPIIKFYAAHTILFSGSLDKVKYYYDYAQRAKEIISRNRTFGSESTKNEIQKIIKEEYINFYTNPELFGTRLPHIFFSTVGSFVFFYLIFYVTASYFLSLFAIILYFSFPELFVGHSMQAYTSISNFSLIMMAYSYILDDSNLNKMVKNSVMFLSSSFAAFADNKTIIFPVTVFLRESTLFLKDKNIKGYLKRIFTNKIILGFALGTFLFWMYGLFIDKEAFLLDHFRYHLFDRIFHRNSLGYEGYLPIFRLWTEFADGLGWPFFIIAVFSIIHFSRDALNKRNKILSFIFLFFIGAAVFSFIDWRETYHLFMIVPFMVVYTVQFISMQKKLNRRIFIGILLFVIARNITLIYKITKNFYIIPSFIRW